jgi:hypothetical protein
MSTDDPSSEDGEPGVWTSAPPTPLTPEPLQEPEPESGLWTSAPDPAGLIPPAAPPAAAPPPQHRAAVEEHGWSAALPPEPEVASPAATPEWDPALSEAYRAKRQSQREQRERLNSSAEARWVAQQEGRAQMRGDLMPTSLSTTSTESSSAGPIIALIVVLILVGIALSQAGVI